MNHIEVAISVLKDEIIKLERDLKYVHNTPEMEEETMERLQKINRAVSDIQKHFNA
jgi:hypothetical protein